MKHPKYSCCECHVAIRQPLWPFKDFAPFKGGLPLSAHFLLSSDKYWGGIFVYKQNIILDFGLEDEDEDVGEEKEDINSDFESSTDDIFELF